LASNGTRQLMGEALAEFAWWADPEGAKVLVVLVHNASGHGAKALKVPANLTVVCLPPYSPELNPVEWLWLYLQQHHWSNRVYPDVETLEEVAVSGWRAVCLRPDKVKSICRCEYLPPGS
jgi:transposase